MLWHMVELGKETLNEKGYSRLASEHMLAKACLDDNQAQKAIDLLELVVAIEHQLLYEDDPDRCVSEDLLMDACRQLDGQRQTSRV